MPERAIVTGPPLSTPAGFPPDLPRALVRAAEDFPDAGVVTVDESGHTERFDYPALADRARRILGGLRDDGVTLGGYAIVHSARTADLLAAYWACVLGGVRPLLVVRPTDPGRAGAVAERLRGAARLLGEPVVLGTADDLAGLSGDELRPLDVGRYADHPPETRTHQPADTDVAMLLMSSGSTGSPKLIQLTHRGLVDFAAGTAAMLPVDPGDTTLNWLPLDHSGAFLLYHLYEVFTGRTNIHVATERVLADPLRWLDLIAAHRVAHTWSPNFGYHLVTAALREAPDRDWDLSSVRSLVSGGEQITVPVMDGFFQAVERYGIAPETFRPCWGMTETCTAITIGDFAPERVHRIRTTSLGGDLERGTDGCVTFVGVGSPAPGATLRVVDSEHRVLPENRIGRLQVSSSRITPGYLGNPDADRTAFPEGDWPPGTWFDTGDLAFVAGGQIVVTGREADRIVLNGQNYFAPAVEEVAAQAPGVADGLVAACGLPDPDTGTERLAVCFATGGSEPGDTADRIRELVFSRLGLAATVVPVPRDEFPRTPSGKVQRSVLRARLLAGDLAAAPPPPAPPAPAPPQTAPPPAASPPAAPATSGPARRQPAEVVRDAFRTFLGGPVDERARFYEVGLDSVKLVRLHHQLQRDLGFDFPRAAMFEHPSVAALTDYLSGLDRGPAPAAAMLDTRDAPEDTRVAIIGMAARFPGADTVEDYWANLRDGMCSVRRFTAEELAASGVPVEDGLVPVSGVLSGVAEFDAGFFGISPREAALTDPAQRLFLECCHHALEHGGYAGTGEGVGVYAGSGMNLYTHQNYLLNNLHGSGDDPVTAMQTAIGTQPDFLATRVAYRLGLTGPAVGVQTACSTSLVAVHLACQALLAGDADLALAGAAAVHVPQVTGYRHTPGSILSPSGQCRAFDADADGTVGGNGVAAVLLKRLDRALADGDTVHAVILGSAVNNDGRSKVSFTAPSVSGQVDAVSRALDRAGVPVETVTYLEAHGTGTPLGDPVEFRALTQAVRRRTDRVGFCTLGSVKSNIGHLDSCAGMAGLVKTVLMLRERTLVPQVNFRRPNPELDLAGSPFVIGTERRPWPADGAPRRAAVSALGVGGTNAYLVLEEPPRVPEPGPVDAPGVLPVSAADPAALDALRTGLRDHLRDHPEVRPVDLVTTLGTGRPHLPYRLAVAGATPAELADALDAAVPGDAPGAEPGGTAFAYTGQGAARYGMADGLYHRFPVVRDVLDEADQAHRETTGRGLADLLLTSRNTDQPWPTDTAQPALFGYQAALTALWRSYGVTPELVLGHSVGEYAALHAAGALSLSDGIRLAALRGELMQRTAPGGMLSVLADHDTVRDLTAGYAVEIAAVNGPSGYVLTGAADEVARLADRLDGAGLTWQRLPVDRAFHSGLLDPVLDEFAARAAEVPLRPLRIPLLSTLTGDLLAPGTVLDAGYLRRQMRQPVRFSDAAYALPGHGCRRVLELGPDRVLTALGRDAVPDLRWIPAQRRDTDPVRATWQALAALYAHGERIDWRTMSDGGRRIPLPGYPFQRRRHWVPAPAPAASPPDGHQEILTVVRELAAGQLGTPVGEVSPDRTFLDLGADSLSMLRVVQDVRRRFGVDLGVRELFGTADTPGRLAALVADRMPTDQTTAEPPAGPGSAPDSAPPTRAQPQPVAAVPPGPAAVVRTEPVVGGSEAGPGEPAAPEAAGLIARQLEIADRMVERVTGLMRDQLAALGQPPAASAASAAPATPAAPARSAAPAMPAAHATAASPTVAPTRAPAAAAPPDRTLERVAVPPPDPGGAGPEPSAGTARCDFSVYFFGDYPDRDQRDQYRMVIDATRYADRHGFHAVWLPERHFHSFGGLFPNPVVLASALARETERIRLHAGSVVLPLHHPARVAEEWSVVDNLSDGRVGLCVASGWHANDFALNPDGYGSHRDLMYQHLDTVRALWSGQAVPLRTGSGETAELRVYPRPVQQKPPLYAAVVSNPDSYRLAAEHDLGVVTNLMAQSPEQLAGNIALYRRTRAEHGLDPEAGRVVLLLHTYLGETVEGARAEAYQPFCDYLRSSLSLFGQVTNSLGFRIDADTPEQDVEFLLEQAYRRYCEGRALIGTVDSTAGVVEPLLAAGVDEIACFIDFGVPAERVMSSLPLVDTLRQRFTTSGTAAPARETAAPLSAAQRGIWFLEQLHPGRTNYHEPKAIRLDGPLDVDALRTALGRVVARHDALRTVFRQVDGELRQLVLPAVAVDCPIVEWDGTEADAVRATLREFSRDLLDLAQGPLLRVRLIRLAPERHVLFFFAHHIVFDSLSTVVFTRDLAGYYRAWPDEPEDLPELPVSYPEHVRLREPDAQTRERDLRYWAATLEGASPLRLPTDRPRPAEPTGNGAALVHRLDAGLARDLGRFSRRHRVTPFMTLLAAVSAVLGRFSGQDDVVVGTALTNRPAGTEDLVGLFIDSVPLRIDLSGEPPLGELVQRVRDASTEAFDHAQVGFDELVSAVNPTRDGSRNPVFNVLVEYERVAEIDFDPPELRAGFVDVPSDRAPLDLTLYLSQHASGVDCTVEYDTDLFDESTVRRLLEYVEALLRRAAEDPSRRLPALTRPTDVDRTALATWCGTAGQAPPGCLHELFERQAGATPDAVALVDGDREVTYRELDRLANGLAHRLHDRGVRADDLVAVCLPRGVDLVTAVLGVLKAGAAYLPLDPAVPRSRMGYLVTDSGAGVLVSHDKSLAERLGMPLLPPDGSAADAPPPRGTGLDNLAYCIYTSGSTGDPKGVAVPHRGPANLVAWYLAHRQPLRTLQWVSIGFDVSVQEIFTALASGTALVVIPDDARYDPATVADTVRRHQVERLVMTYTALKSLMDSDPAMPSLREVISLGEPLELTPGIRRFLAAHPECALFNEYGPTEASIIVTSHRVDPDAGDRPPIGRPIDNVVARVLDERRRPVPVGVVGELCLGGACLAREYVGLPEATDAAFVPDPEAPGGFLYRTGDLARWLPGGVLQHLGRADDQVKIRGNRVEPAEPERVLRALPEVRDAAVTAGTDPRGDICLIGYVVPDSPGITDRLADRLAETLPGYLIPAAWVELPSLPVNPSGKLDRARLPDPDWDTTAGPADPATPAERRLAALWAAQLGVAEVPLDRSFFQLGGHSLTAVELTNRVRETFAVDYRVVDLFRGPTVRAMARHLDSLTGAGVETLPADAPAEIAPAGTGSAETAPVTSGQRRCWELHRGSGHPEVYNVGHRITLHGDLDPRALEQALAALVRRHAALRTRIVADEGTPRQEVLPSVPVTLPVTDLAGDADAVTTWCRDQVGRPIAPDHAPLWRASLGRLAGDRWELVLVLHHLICDGWSMGVLWHELSTLYTGGDLPDALPFPEYARWRAEAATGPRRAELERYWRAELGGAPPRLNLPYDHERPERLSGEGALHRFQVPGGTGRIEEAARGLGGTPAQVLTAAFAVWIANLCDQTDLVFAVSSAGRLMPEHNGVVGPVGEAMPLRLTLGDGDVVAQVREKLAEGLAHHELGYAQILEAVRPGSGTGPVSPQVLCTVVTTPPAALDLPGVSATVGSLSPGDVARTELYVVFLPRDGALEVVIEYTTDLFEPKTVEAWEPDLLAVLDDLLVSSSRDRSPDAVDDSQ